MAHATFGTYFKELRIQSGATLRSFCEKHGFDAGNLSRLERGLLPPPHSQEKLSQYADALGLDEGSDPWYEFFDLAAAERGRVPKDLLSDTEVVEKLPVFFRTLRGQQVPKADLDALVERIRRA